MPPPHSLPSLFAQAFDELVESYGKGMSFLRQAELAAVFTKLYIQNLFGWNKASFLEVMKRHRSLNRKAAAYERRGKSPQELLVRQVLLDDDLGKVLKRYTNHLGALDCILDSKASTALVHHILQLQPRETLPAQVTGGEFGSGTGILSIAGAIPFISQGKTITIHAFEQAQPSREDAQKIVDILQEYSKYRQQLHIHIHPGDITTPAPYKQIKEAEELSGPLALWISETFGYQSHAPIVSKEKAIFCFKSPQGIPPYSLELEKRYDPLRQVLERSCDQFDSFIEKINQGEIIAFPDVVTPKVIINGTASSMLASDGVWRPLHAIGEPYQMLPPCSQSRWYIDTPGTSEKKAAQGGSLKKKRKKRKYHCR